MRENWNQRIVGERVVLVPYRRAHVEMYHKWMQDPELLESTASEPLSLSEEYEMQASWRDDPLKCTFIVLDGSDLDDVNRLELDSSCLAQMVGDVNLFLNCDGDCSCAEIEIMIAESSARRKGLAKDALNLITRFGRVKLGLKRFIAKIGQANSASLQLFEEHLGYSRVSFCDTFKEHTLELTSSVGRNADSSSLTMLSDTCSDNSSGGYESVDMIDMYMGFHYGQHDKVVQLTIRPGHAPVSALRFPQRCAELVYLLFGEHVQGKSARSAKVLDLGCAVGASTLELTKWFGFAHGIDLSAGFIAAAKRVRNASLVSDENPAVLALEFEVKVEGNLRRKVPLVMDPSTQRTRARFTVGDACALSCAKDLGGPFDAVLMGNLLCRVPSPRKCLEGLSKVLNKGAIVVIVSPYSWLEQYTAPEEWLQEGCLNGEMALKDSMEKLGYKHVLSQDMPALIREHERLYQFIVPGAMAFQFGL